jgi:hypothetical protein
MGYTFICSFSCILPYSSLCSWLHLQEFIPLSEANSCACMLVTNGAVAWYLHCNDHLFGAFFTNVEISTNRPTSTSRKIKN